jgi:hypothetical protein
LVGFCDYFFERTSILEYLALDLDWTGLERKN